MATLRNISKFFKDPGKVPSTRTLDDLISIIQADNMNLEPTDLDREVFQIPEKVLSFGPLKKVNGSLDYSKRMGHFAQYPGSIPVNGERPGFILPFEKYFYYEKSNAILYLFEPDISYLEILKNTGKTNITPRNIQSAYTSKDMITYTHRHP